MNRDIKVSIIVPVYNVERYLIRCLDSLVNQTLSDIEVVVINDGSPDGSQVIIDDYELRFPNIIRSYKKNNSGLSDTRNYGIAKALGEYIGFVDGDDYVDITMFEKLYKKAKQKSADITVCEYYRINENTKEIKHLGIEYTHLFDKSIWDEPDLLFVNTPYVCTKLFNRSFLINSGILFPEGLIFEDIPTTYSLFTKANIISKVSEPLYYYTYERDGAITSSLMTKHIQLLSSLEILNDYYINNNYFKKFEQQLHYINLKHILIRLRRFSTCKNKLLAAKFVRSSFKHIKAYFPDWKNEGMYKNSYSRLKVNNIQKTKFYWVSFIFLGRYKNILKKIMNIFR